MMRTVVLLVAILGAAVAAPYEEGDSSSSSDGTDHKRPTKPHLVYVLVDEWGNDEIGYNNAFFETPYMDALAAGGIKLTHFYAATMCTPSRARLMTGKYEFRLGLQSDVIRPDTPYGMPLYVETMPERLRPLGYSTHMVGKWHLGHFKKEYTPLNRGFDTFYGYYNGVNDYLNHSMCCPIDCLNQYGYDMRDGDDPAPIREIDNIYDTLLYTRESERVFDRYRKEDGKSVFLYLSSHDVHFYPSLQAPQKYIDIFLPKTVGMDPAVADRMSRLAAKVATVDDMVHNVVESLKANDMWDNTILIVTTDNGRFPRGFPAYFTIPLVHPAPSEAKDGRQRGPAFIASPLLPDSAKGTVIDDLTTIADFFPTMLNLAGDNIDPATTDGVDLWDLLVNNKPSSRTEYLQMIDHGEELVGTHMFPNSFDSRQLAAIRIGDYKLATGCYDMFPTTWDNGTYLQKGCHKFFVDHGRNYYLWNIRQDEDEQNDLADDADHQDRIMYMLERLKYWDDQSVPPLHEYPQAAPTNLACPNNIADNDGRTYKFFGPYITGPDWQLSINKK